MSFKIKTNKDQWKKWCCWVLDEEEIKMSIEKMGLDFEKFTEEEIEHIAETFKEWLAQSENDFWMEWIQESIKQVTINLDTKVKGGIA